VQSGLRVLRIGQDAISRQAADPKQLLDFAKELGLDVAAKVPAWLGTKLLIG
jgi:hypothetical protein